MAITSVNIIVLLVIMGNIVRVSDHFGLSCWIIWDSGSSYES